LVATAKLNGLDPEALHNVISCIADHPVNRVSKVLLRTVANKLPHMPLS